MVISLAFAGAPMVTSFAGPPMESDTAFAGGAPAGGGGAAPSSAGATAFTVLGLNSNDVADGLKLKLGASALSLGLGSSPSFAIGFFLSPPRSLCHRSKGFLGPFRRTAFVFAFVSNERDHPRARRCTAFAPSPSIHARRRGATEARSRRDLDPNVRIYSARAFSVVIRELV